MKRMTMVILIICIMAISSSLTANAMPGRVVNLAGYWEFTLPDGNSGWMTFKYTEASAMEVYDIWFFCKGIGKREYYGSFNHGNIVRPNTWYGVAFVGMREDTGIEGMGFIIIDSNTIKMKIHQSGGKYNQAVFIARKK